MYGHHQFDDHCGVPFVGSGQTPIRMAAKAQIPAVLLRLLERHLIAIIALLPH
jgi:hypothetical protein